MATPDCDLENGGDGSSCGGNDSAVPGVQNRGSASRDPAPSPVSFLLLYYFLFMLYLIGFSKTWWHAALGIAVGAAFLVLSCCLDFSTPPQVELSDDSTRQCLILVLYYFFFMFYLFSSSEYWWHEALGIVLVTGFVLLSFLLCALHPQGCKTPEGDEVKTPDGDGSDLSITLLRSRN